MPTWDELFKQEHHRRREPHAAVVAFAEELGRSGARRVYDQGCGAGRHAVYLAQGGFEVYASDISPRALELTRSWLQAQGLGAKLVLCDMTVVPYPDGFFDCAISMDVIQHNTTASIARVFAELLRTLRPGGRILISVSADCDPRRGTGQQIEAMTFVLTDGPEAGVPHHFFTREELEALLAGFDPESIALDPEGRHWLVRAAKRLL